jgi:hypothetical protein
MATRCAAVLRKLRGDVVHCRSQRQRAQGRDGALHVYLSAVSPRLLWRGAHVLQRGGRPRERLNADKTKNRLFRWR